MRFVVLTSVTLWPDAFPVGAVRHVWGRTLASALRGVK